MAFRDWCKKENPDAKAAEAGVDRLLAGAELQPAEEAVSQAGVDNSGLELGSDSDEAGGQEESEEESEEEGEEEESEEEGGEEEMEEEMEVEADVDADLEEQDRAEEEAGAAMGGVEKEVVGDEGRADEEEEEQEVERSDPAEPHEPEVASGGPVEVGDKGWDEERLRQIEQWLKGYVKNCIRAGTADDVSITSIIQSLQGPPCAAQPGDDYSKQWLRYTLKGILKAVLLKEQRHEPELLSATEGGQESSGANASRSPHRRATRPAYSFHSARPESNAILLHPDHQVFAVTKGLTFGKHEAILRTSGNPVRHTCICP